MKTYYNSFDSSAAENKFTYAVNEMIDDRFLVLDRTKGGMSDIYFCFDLDINELKPGVLKSPIEIQQNRLKSKTIIGDFRDEIKIWTDIGYHKNIVECKVFYADKYENPYVLLEWVKNKKNQRADLRQIINGPLDISFVIKIALGICTGMQYACEQVPGIVHCDLKPENILLNNEITPKITDFGISRILSSLTMENDSKIIRGTYFYMAPEIWTSAEYSIKSDIYSFGCILYELITGELTYYADDIKNLKNMHITGRLPLLPNNLPTELQEIIKTCLNKNSKNRFDSFEEIASILQQINTKPDIDSNSGQNSYTAFYYGNKALSCMNINDYEKAKEYFSKAFELDPYLSRAYNNRALMYSHMKDYTSALADFDKAIEIDPYFVEALNNRATVYSEINRIDEAINDLLYCLEIEPLFLQAYGNLAGCYLQNKDYSNALSICNRYNEGQFTINYPILFVKAECYLQIGFYQKSYNLYEEILQNSTSTELCLKAMLRKLDPLVKINCKTALVEGANMIRQTIENSLSWIAEYIGLHLAELFLIEKDPDRAAATLYLIKDIANEKKLAELLKKCIGEM